MIYIYVCVCVFGLLGKTYQQLPQEPSAKHGQEGGKEEEKATSRSKRACIRCVGKGISAVVIASVNFGVRIIERVGGEIGDIDIQSRSRFLGRAPGVCTIARPGRSACRVLMPTALVECLISILAHDVCAVVPESPHKVVGMRVQSYSSL